MSFCRSTMVTKISFSNRRPASRLWMVALLGGVALVSGCREANDAPQTPVLGTATLEIVLPESENREDIVVEVDCREKSTVFSIMESAQQDQKIVFTHRINLTGSPESIFVESVEGVAIGEDQFWVYYVNGELAKQGCGSMPVAPGDQLKWVFGQPPSELGGD